MSSQLVSKLQASSFTHCQFVLLLILQVLSFSILLWFLFLDTIDCINGLNYTVVFDIQPWHSLVIRRGELLSSVLERKFMKEEITCYGHFLIIFWFPLTQTPLDHVLSF